MLSKRAIRNLRRERKFTKSILKVFKHDLSYKYCISPDDVSEFKAAVKIGNGKKFTELLNKYDYSDRVCEYAARTFINKGFRDGWLQCWTAWVRIIHLCPRHISSARFLQPLMNIREVTLYDGIHLGGLYHNKYYPPYKLTLVNHLNFHKFIPIGGGLYDGVVNVVNRYNAWTEQFAKLILHIFITKQSYLELLPVIQQINDLSSYLGYLCLLSDIKIAELVISHVSRTRYLLGHINFKHEWVNVKILDMYLKKIEIIPYYIEIYGYPRYQLEFKKVVFNNATDLEKIRLMEQYSGIDILKYAVTIGYIHDKCTLQNALLWSENTPAAIRAICEKFGKTSFVFDKSVTRKINFLNKLGIPQVLIYEIYLYL